MLSKSFVYQLYATMTAFYIPLLIMTTVYGLIFCLTRKMAKLDPVISKPVDGAATPLRKNSADASNNHHIHANAVLNGRTHRSSYGSNSGSGSEGGTGCCRGAQCCMHALMSTCFPCCKSSTKTKGNKSNKATKTLGVIMGTFIVCWLPFFILALIRPFEHVDIPPILLSITNWVGYFSSCLNPFIYARYNRDFRLPFKLFLTCHCQKETINLHIRQVNYYDLYGAEPTIPHVPSRQVIKNDDSRLAPPTPTLTTSVHLAPPSPSLTGAKLAHYESASHTLTFERAENGSNNGNGAKAL